MKIITERILRHIEYHSKTPETLAQEQQAKIDEDITALKNYLTQQIIVDNNIENFKYGIYKQTKQNNQIILYNKSYYDSDTYVFMNPHLNVNATINQFTNLTVSDDDNTTVDREKAKYNRLDNKTTIDIVNTFKNHNLTTITNIKQTYINFKNGNYSIPSMEEGTEALNYQTIYNNTTETYKIIKQQLNYTINRFNKFLQLFEIEPFSDDVLNGFKLSSSVGGRKSTHLNKKNRPKK